MAKLPITGEGHRKLQQELKRLLHEDRPAIVKAIETARDHGDLSENAEYHAAKERQSFIEGRIKELEDQIVRAEIINPATLKGDRVMFGATVTLQDQETADTIVYQIVGDTEGDVQRGRITISSPIARAAIGKRVGEDFTVATPRAARDYLVLAIRFVGEPPIPAA